jgi:DNA-binding NtrC family response regulator
VSKGVILIVEDDPLQRRLIKENLEQEEYQVVEASSGKEALMILNDKLIDSAVVDYKLNGETGIQVIEEILEKNPFVTPIMVTAFGNILSLPESLIESELFGSEKGSIPGAYERKIGKFEAAASGTLFLDEIGDLPAHIQVKLLRAIQ